MYMEQPYMYGRIKLHEVCLQKEVEGYLKEFLIFFYFYYLGLITILVYDMKNSLQEIIIKTTLLNVKRGSFRTQNSDTVLKG